MVEQVSRELKNRLATGRFLVWRASVAGAPVLSSTEAGIGPRLTGAERPALGYGAHVPNHLNPMLKRFDGHLGETRAQ